MTDKAMSYTDQMEMTEIDEIINDSFCNDESSNDFNATLQVSTVTSIVSHAQTNNINKSIPIHKTRSGLKYNKRTESLTLKRVNSNASCSLPGNDLPSPSKILNTVILHTDLLPNLDDVEDDEEDDAMEYDAEDQNESAVSSPQTSINKYKMNTSSSLNNKLDNTIIDENSLISSTLSIIDPSVTNINSNVTLSSDSSFPSFNLSAQITNSSTSQFRQTHQRIKRSVKPIRKIMKSSKIFLVDKSSSKSGNDESIFLMPRYPLRSRARLEKVKIRLRDSVVGSKSFDSLPVEIYYRIFQYLPIQDLFRMQRINKRFKDSVDNHLIMVKRINFSCGLPFAFLPDCLNDAVLKRILSKTPEVTHILGFYPRKIEDVPGIDNSLTYSGIMSALRQCSKLRSVEIMDLELMSRVVHALSRVKFHGMFRNRPYSWEDEYANPLLNKNGNSSSNNATPVQLFENVDIRQSASKYGICNKLSASLCNWVGFQQVNSKELHMNFINYVWLSFLEQMSYTSTGQGLPLLQPINQGAFVNLITPIPPSIDKLIIPTTINNLTKLDLVSVCIQHLPRLENIKYLHLKWVRFSSPDPFTNFQAPKIQSFVMNNCIGPIRGMRYVRIFTALARSTQLNRLELVSTRIVEGLFENFFLDNDQGHRCFRNLLRLVLASNKEFGEVDVATLLLSSHASLNHLALSVSHSRNSLMLSLVNAKVTMQRLESVILGYQDPFQSMLTGVEIHNLGLHDSPDHSLPTCKITDRGVAALLKLAPKLLSLHLRHAIYVEDPMMWLSKNWPYPIGNKPINPQDDSNNEEDYEKDQQNNFYLKSLTLENCSGIRPESISFILNHPATCFPQLEMLVLRDMFPRLSSCPISQTEFDQSMFNSCFSRDTRRQSTSCNSLTKNLSCRGKLVNYSTVTNNTEGRIRTQIIEGLNDRFCALPIITTPGICHNHEPFNNSSLNNSIPMGDSLDNNNPNTNRFSRIFISNMTSNDIRLTNNDSGMFGMSSTGLALHNGAGAQVLGAQHTNLGASIRQNEILRPPMIVNAMKNIIMLHKLENLGLAKTVLWDEPNNNNNQSCVFDSNISSINLTDQFPRNMTMNKRKRSRSSDISNQMIHGLYFHNSLLPKSKSYKPPKKDHCKQEKIIKKRKFVDQSNNDNGNIEENITDFQSIGTQTCICGYIDWLDSSWQHDSVLSEELNLNRHVPMMKILKTSDGHHASPHKAATSKGAPSNKVSFVNISDYGCRLCSLPVDNFGEQSTISLSKPEIFLEHKPREWQAQNASVDTMSLRLYLRPPLYSLDLKQNTFAHLTTLHFEKVGITHLVLSSCHRLKSITLENCPELQAIVINSGTAPPSDSMPNLRRIRIMRCPKFAIYHLLYNVTRFYPQHDDNLYITYRPFGEYNPLVEKALWVNSDSQHVMVSHEYRQASSERNLEELCSSFDQLFREMLNFSESLIRRDILTVSDFLRVNSFTNGSFLRSEHGTDWDLLTDIPWISEVCCSMLPSDLTRTQQADQLYELLSEIQSHLGHMKLRRRGIHLHVQFRDVHKPWMIDSSSLINDVLPASSFSYLPFPYTDSYLHNTHPKNDHNANHCEPSLSNVYSDLNQDSADFDFFTDFYNVTSQNCRHDFAILPLHLQDLFTDNHKQDFATFGLDINERVPIPQQFNADKILKSSSHRRAESSTNSVINESSAEYMANKIYKFRATITALKKSNESNNAHSTRSRTAEMNIDSRLRPSSSTSANVSTTRASRHG